jgi:hypothetical protein
MNAHAQIAAVEIAVKSSLNLLENAAASGNLN